MIYVWLKEGQEKLLKALHEEGCLGDYRVLTYDVGRKSIIGDNPWKLADDPTREVRGVLELQENLFDPLANIPELAPLAIERVTLIEMIPGTSLQNGTYEPGATKILIKPTVLFKDHASAVMQEIRLTAPTVAEAKEIYGRLRRRGLTPDVPWCA